MGTAASPITGNQDDVAGGSAGSPEMDESAERETARLRSEIARTRAELGGTIEALHGRLNPTVLKEQALDQFHEAKETIKAEVKAEIDDAKSAVREATIGRVENMVENAETTVKETTRSIGNTIRENPIPAALVGIGLAWLFMSRRTSDNGRVTGTLQRTVGDVTHRVGDMAQQAQTRVGDVAHRAGDMAQQAQARVGDMAHQAQRTISEKAHQAGEAVSTLAHNVEEQGRRIENRAETMYYSNPLAAGAVVLAVGTAVGLAIPITRKEDEWMGKARDQVMQKAQGLAHEALGKVEDIAKDAGNGVTKALSAGDESQQGSSGQQESLGAPSSRQGTSRQANSTSSVSSRTT